jgi:hypothetical protein
MGRQLGFAKTACDRGGNDGGAVSVADIVLHDQHGSESALLASDDGAEIRIENISAFDGHFVHSFFFQNFFSEEASRFLLFLFLFFPYFHLF